MEVKFKVYEQTIAVVGAGHWGKNLIRNFDEIGALRSICDTDEKTLESYKYLNSKPRLSKNYQEVIDDKLIDAIAIAVPAEAHYSLAKDALLSGKDVFVEKPFCLELEQAQELLELADKLGRIVMVGHLLHYHPCIQTIKELLNKNILGNLQYISVHRLNLGKLHTETNVLYSLATHDISVLLSLCDDLPYKITCHGGDFTTKGIADTSLLAMSFSNGVEAHIFSSWLNPFKEQKFTLVGSKGMLVFDDTVPWGEKLLLYPQAVIFDEYGTPDTYPGEAKRVQVEKSEPLQNECRHFLECCLSRRKAKTDAEEGLRVMQVLDAAEKSFSSKGMQFIKTDQGTYVPRMEKVLF